MSILVRDSRFEKKRQSRTGYQGIFLFLIPGESLRSSISN